MMDIRSYIESGIIESYVLGLSTAEETAEVEQTAAAHNEVKEAILDFQALIENEVSKDELHPPAFIKTNIQNILFSEFLSQPAAVKHIPQPNKDAAIVRSINTLKYVAAASVILLVISTTLNFYFYSAFKDSSSKYEALVSERNTLEANNAAYKTRLDDINQSLEMIKDPHMVNITMKGVKGRENNLATVYWNPDTKEVFLLPNKMPKAPEGKQYQLWAIVDGKPVDAGMVGYDCAGLCKMKIINRAQAFAITLEKQGGSPVPTMDQMYVMGKAS